MTHHAGITLHYHGAGPERYGHTHAFLSIMHDHDLWSCSHCGPHPESSANWCAKGCGRDYNRMERVAPTEPGTSDRRPEDG